MPELQGVLLWAERITLGYFTLINSFYLLFSVFAFFALLAYTRRTWRGDLELILTESAYRPISILVPAHDEQDTIVANVQNLLTLRYPEFEVVVVNDGSSDRTLEVLREAFDLLPVPSAIRTRIDTQPIRGLYRSLDHPNLVVMDKENGGKSDALNAAINASAYPLFCCIDADSLLESDALLRVARVFAEDESVVAVGGIVRVLNGCRVQRGHITQTTAARTTIVLCQVLEYLRGFLAGRTALGSLNSLLIISGAFGLFRKERVIDAGGFDRRTVCEDMEIVVRLHRDGRARNKPTRVVFVPDPVCWTQVPDDWRSLLRQRDRWQRGMLQTLWMHRGMLFNPRYGAVGLFGFPFYVVFEAFGSIVETAGYLLIPLLWYYDRLSPGFLVLFLVLAVLYGILISLTTLILDDLLFRRYERPGDLGRLMLACFVEYLGFRQVLALTRTAAWITVFFKKAQWGRPLRKTFQDHHEERAAATGEL